MGQVAVVGQVAELSQRCRGMSRRCRGMSRGCRGMSRECRGDVAGCRENVAGCREDVAEMSPGVASVSPSVTEMSTHVTLRSTRRHVDISSLGWGIKRGMVMRICIILVHQASRGKRGQKSSAPTPAAPRPPIPRAMSMQLISRTSGLRWGRRCSCRMPRLMRHTPSALLTIGVPPAAGA